MDANHQPLQRFWPFTRDSLHIGSHHKQAAPRFVLEAPGWSHLHVVLQLPAKDNKGDSSCANQDKTSAENNSLNSREADVFFMRLRLPRSSALNLPSILLPSLWYHQLWEPGNTKGGDEWSGYLSILILMLHPGPDFGTFPMRVNSPVMATSACFGRRLSQGSHRLSALKIRWRFNKAIYINPTLSQHKSKPLKWSTFCTFGSTTHYKLLQRTFQRAAQQRRRHCHARRWAILAGAPNIRFQHCANLFRLFFNDKKTSRAACNCTVLHYIVLYYVIPRCIALHYIMFYHIPAHSLAKMKWHYIVCMHWM